MKKVLAETMFDLAYIIIAYILLACLAGLLLSLGPIGWILAVGLALWIFRRRCKDVS